MELGASLLSIKGIGPAIAAKFAALGLRTVGDLVQYYPRVYEDYSNVTPIKQMHPGMVTIRARIGHAKGRYVRRGMHITEAIAKDETGSILVVWFNQPYREAGLKADAEYFITGKLELKYRRFTISNPAIELVSNFPVNTARILPIYRETKGITSNQIRTAIKQLLPAISLLPEVLPGWIREQYELMSMPEAIRQIHFPESQEALDAARRTLGFTEVFELMSASLLIKSEIETEHAIPIPFEEPLVKSFVESLPFKLTDAQRKVAWQIFQDMERSTPMNRLVEGDVGSGKTVVATLAAIVTLKQGLQVALLAPTELLARQHAESIVKLLQPVGLEHMVSVLVGSLKTAQKRIAHEHIKAGHIGFLVGTQALLQEKVELAKLGLVIIDEQHRFGVEQRKTLQKKAGHMPHVLSMTATPIPRSLALTLYGEMDISIIETMPVGRKPIITEIANPNSRATLYKHVDAEITKGRQVYMVCPLIAEGSKLEAVSAEALYESLRKKEFKHRRVGLLHGKLKDEEKDAVMKRFAAGEIDILVSTTVIEVGVNVPNASVMVIEGADRFGLAQMHQLRGRVGRSEHQSYCYIVPSDGNKQPSKRLRALEQSTNGFKLAELDLELRGPGAIYGTLQHGDLDLRFAELNDTRLLRDARHASEQFLANEKLSDFPELSARIMAARAVVTLN